MKQQTIFKKWYYWVVAFMVLLSLVQSLNNESFSIAGFAGFVIGSIVSVFIISFIIKWIIDFIKGLIKK